MIEPRDYDGEIKDTANHQYAYDFDLHVMQPLHDPIVRAVLQPGKPAGIG